MLLLTLLACSEYDLKPGTYAGGGQDTACELPLPELSVSTPVDGQVMDPDEPVELVAEAISGDEVNLDVLWSSDVDGEIGTSLSTTWSTARTEGDHLLTVSAVDDCGQSALAQVSVCQQAGYAADELDISTWNFEGSASWDSSNDWVQLTSLGEYEVGSAFQTSQEIDGSNVNIRFSFYIGEGTGADGISLTAIDTERMSTYLGGSGCGIGYGGDASCTDGPALPGWSIEVDTYHNGGQDPTTDDHLMFTFDGDVDDPEVWVAIPEVEDTGWHTLEVSVVDPRVTVTLDGTTYIDQDISGYLDFPAHIGFTGGTGGLTNYHRIQSLTVTEYVCPE